MASSDIFVAFLKATVDGRIPAPVDMVNIPITYKVLYIPGGCFGFLPSTVSWVSTHRNQETPSGYPSPRLQDAGCGDIEKHIVEETIRRAVFCVLLLGDFVEKNLGCFSLKI